LLHTGAKFFYLQEATKIYSTPHTGANFSIFMKLEKFIQHDTLGQIFPFLSGEKLKNSKSHLNGPREGVRPKICWNEPHGGVSLDSAKMVLVKE
jgi:hypothetical protein